MDVWPGNLKSIELRGGMTSIEMWILKERMDAGLAKPLHSPEKLFGSSNKYYTIYGDNASGVYTVCTIGNPVGWVDACWITAINKLTIDQASRLLSGWPYE